MTIGILSKEYKTISTADSVEKSFGFRTVDRVEKQALVNEVFHSVARKYDIMNDVMSSGIHRLWKNAMVAWLAPPQRMAGWQILDIAGGTGDIAFRIVKVSGWQARVLILDINQSMLKVGREYANKKGYAACVDFIEANAEAMPFEDNRFDACTISFGIRNMSHINRVLEESWRVLKPGGRFMCLEFSEVAIPLLDRLYDVWSFYGIPKIGKMIANDTVSYSYLIESIRRFPKQQNFAEIIRQAGFSRVSYRNLTGGIVAIHSGWKI
ncbi:MAG: 4-benzoquinol methylase [Candidatus Tokpelaia sp. JSC085]|nr:MAG: 4-benzoquinol methylase [Candidatus Tokpelaia sp. JSC085]